jgi:hypothetical protein
MMIACSGHFAPASQILGPQASFAASLLPKSLDSAAFTSHWQPWLTKNEVFYLAKTII